MQNDDAAGLGLVFVTIYLVLFALAMCIFLMYAEESAFAAMYVVILTLPWSALAAVPISLLEIGLPGTFIILSVFAVLNVPLLYRLGEKLQ